MTLEADVRVGLGALELRVPMRVEDGETVAMLGPNGAGKTTFLRALAGLVPLDRGTITLGGLVLDDPAAGTWVTTEQRPIGFVFQEHLLFPHLSALDNVAFGLRTRGRAKRAARGEASGWLTRMGLANRLDAKPRELSGGEAQRVALARALAIDPQLLLLDEPLAALDATTRIEVRRLLLHGLGGFAGPRIVVTHDPVDAMTLADRVVVIEDGRVTQAGSLDDLRNRPRSRYVADLIGVNLYRGVVDGERFTVPESATALRVVSDDPRRRDAFALVRPHAVALHRVEPEGSARNAWAGTVSAVDLEGERVRVRIEGSIPITAEITASALHDLALAVGAPTWVSVKATEIEVFPA